MDSGFHVNQDILTYFADMKAGKKKTRFITLKADRAMETVNVDVVYHKTSDQKKDWEHLISQISPYEGCYIILDLEASTKSGSSKEQLLFITWNPDSGCVNSRTLISSAHFAVSRALRASESCVMVQANDMDDVDYDFLLKKAMK